MVESEELAHCTRPLSPEPRVSVPSIVGRRLLHFSHSLTQCEYLRMTTLVEFIQRRGDDQGHRDHGSQGGELELRQQPCVPIVAVNDVGAPAGNYLPDSDFGSYSGQMCKPLSIVAPITTVDNASPDSTARTSVNTWTS